MQEKKKALGRGLEQLFTNEILDFDSFENNIVESASQDEILEINLNEIRSNPYQPRKTFDQNSLDELASSIRAYGVFQPVILKKSIKGYDLVAGERRVKASKLAGKTTIPAIIRDFTDNEMREIALLENLQRENLTAIELAWAYKGIIDSLHIRQEDLAEKIGKSRSHITNMLGLLRLPKNVQDMILNNKISMGHARVLSKIDDIEKIRELANRIIEQNLSVHDLESLTSNNDDIKKKNIVLRKNTNNDYQYLKNSMQELLGTKVKFSNKKMEIYFENINDLNRILEIMNINIE